MVLSGVALSNHRRDAAFTPIPPLPYQHPPTFQNFHKTHSCPVLERVLIEVTHDWRHREQRFPIVSNHSLAHEKVEFNLSLKISAVMHQMRVHHEITQVAWVCARNGKIPGDIKICEIQKQSAIQVKSNLWSDRQR